MPTKANPANGDGVAETDLLDGDTDRKDTLPPVDYQASLYLHRLYERAEVDRDGIAELKRQRVDVDHMLNVVGPVVRVLAGFPGDGSFAPDSMGEAAFVIPVMGNDAETHLDVVAWAARDPGAFGTLFGKAGLLGAEAIMNPASFHDGPCPIWSTPLRWLQSGCSGAVLLNAELARSIFAGAPVGGRFVAEDLDLAHRLVAFGLVPSDHLLVLDWRTAA